MRIPIIAYTILLLLAVGLLFRLGNENFLSVYNLNTIVSFAAVLLMVALGQMCAILIGGIDLSVGGLISFISVVFTVLVKPVGYWVFPLCMLIGIFVLFSVVLRFTSVGRKIFYVGSNIKMSWMSGIDVTKTRNFAFVLSGLGASIAGIMISSVRYGGDPVAGQVYILKSIAAVVVGGTALTGGTGGPANTLFGTLLMSVLDNGMNVVGIDPFFQQSILGFMIIVSVVLTFERGKTQMIK